MSDQAEPEIGVSMLMRCRTAGAAGEGIPAGDAGLLAYAIDRMLMGGDFAQAFGLDIGWRNTARAMLVASADLPNAERGQVSAATRDLRQRLQRYFKNHFDADLLSPRKPEGERGILYRLILRAGGTVPSEGTVRGWVNPLKSL